MPNSRIRTQVARWPQALAGLMILIAGTGSVRAADEADVQPPIANQPVDYSGAVGKFKVSTRAAPLELPAEDPLGVAC